MTIDIVIGRTDYLRSWSKYTELFTHLFDIVSSLRQWTIDQVFDDDITSEELVAILHAPNYHLRYEAVTRLRNYPAVLTTVIPDLIQIMVANGSMRLNHAIRQTLATVSDAAAPQLRPLLSPDNDERLHWHAVSTLRLMGCDALEVIIDAWPTASDDLRRRIAVILCSFPQYPDYVVPLLLDALKSIDSDLRFDAVKALKCFQLFASDAVPILEALLKDEPDIARRREIEGVLKLITEAG